MSNLFDDMAKDYSEDAAYLVKFIHLNEVNMSSVKLIIWQTFGSSSASTSTSP